MYKVVLQPNPFKIEKFIREYPVSENIQQVYHRQHIDIPIEQCKILINDEVVTDYTRTPVDGDIVIIKALPAGEDAGEKIGQFFLKAAFATIGGIIGFVVGGPLGAAMGVVGGWSLVAGALNNEEYDTVKKNYSFTGANNEKEQYGIVPVVYGTTKYSPSYGGSDYTEFVDVDVDASDGGERDTWLHQLYVIGYKPTIVETVRIGDNILLDRGRVDITSAVFSGTNTITKAGSFSDTAIFKVGMDILIEDSVNYGEYKVTGVTDDTLVCTAAGFTNGTENITLGYLVGGQFITPAPEYEFIKDGIFAGSLYPNQVSETTLNKVCKHNLYQYFTTPDNIKDIAMEFGFLSGLCKVNSEGNPMPGDDRPTVYFTIEAQVHGSGAWVMLFGENETGGYTGNTKEPYRFTKSYTLGDRGTYDIRVKRTTENSISTSVHDVLTWVSAKTYAVDSDGNKIDPILSTTASSLLLMALKVKATSQLSGTINNLTVEATRWVEDYVYADDTSPYSATDTTCYEVRETHNPASMFLDVLTNSNLAQHPVTFNGDNFDLTSIKRWHQWCTVNNLDDDGDLLPYTCNGILLNSTTVKEELRKICAVGRAEFAVIDGKYTINQLIEDDSAVQLFTARNIVKDSFSVTRSFDRIPDGVNVQFVNADVGYIMDEIGLGTAPNTVQTVSFGYVDNYTQARGLGQFILNSFQNQILGYQFKTAIDNLVVTRGDKILLQHDAALLAITSGRVTAYTEDGGGLLTTLTVDENCAMSTGNDYGITVRTPTDIFTFAVFTVDGDNSVLTITNGSISDIAAGDLFSFGLLSHETSECLVSDIQYDSNTHATISAIQYDEDIYDLGETPVWSSDITPVGTGQNIVNVDTYSNVEETLEEIIDDRNNNVSTRVFTARPIPPYEVSDLWIDNTKLYDCVIEKASDGVYADVDWRLRSSSTFDVLNKDTFNETTPEHRWAQIPGDALPYNLLTTTAHTVTGGDGTKEKFLIDDANEWESLDTLSAVTVEATGASNIITKSNATDIAVVGRYEVSGYMGEAFTNMFSTPLVPITQDIAVTSGETYCLQVYRGTLTCSYGVSSYGVPLTFVSTATENITVTVDADCRYPSMTHTTFLTPFVNGSFSNNSDSQSITGTTATIKASIVNVPSDTSYGGIVSFYKDANDYIDFYMQSGRFYLDIMASGDSFFEDITGAVAGDYTFTFDWTTGFILTINGDTHTYTEDGDYYGWGTDGYGFGTDYYGFGDSAIVMGVLTDAYLGLAKSLYFNNTITEVTV